MCEGRGVRAVGRLSAQPGFSQAHTLPLLSTDTRALLSRSTSSATVFHFKRCRSAAQRNVSQGIRVTAGPRRCSSAEQGSNWPRWAGGAAALRQLPRQGRAVPRAAAGTTTDAAGFTGRAAAPLTSASQPHSQGSHSQRRQSRAHDTARTAARRRPASRVGGSGCPQQADLPQFKVSQAS